MKKILSLLVIIALAISAQAQMAGAGPLVVCEANQACEPDLNGHFSTGVVPYAPALDYFPEIRTCEPLDMCITLHCPASINLSTVGLGNGSITLRGVQVKGFGGLPEGVDYCISDPNWQPDGYYTLHLTGTPQQAGTYQLKLSAVLQGSFLSVNTDTFFPNGMDAIAVTVVEGQSLQADFTSDIREVIAGNAVNFTNTTTGYQATREWTFEGGNPATSSDENPRVMYSTPGTYAVKLKVTNACNENEKVETAYITVTEAQTIEAPVADFGFVVSQQENGFAVQFNDLSTNLPTSWSWTFEGGEPATSNDQNPQVTYASEGDFRVTLTVTNEAGSDTKTQSISVVDIEDFAIDNVSVYPNPTASILNIEGEDIYSVSLIDAAGKIVFEEKDSISAINMENFAKGSYILNVETSKGILQKKVIKVE